MVRAGVFIGVDKTGNLQKLNDAAAGARRMYQWALRQGMPDQTHAKLITDEGGKKVDPSRIYDAIKEIIDGPGADQLILYFAGHGVNINRSERWLLSDAPEKTSAAVDVYGSVELARYCGIGHVVLISDACRVAPEGIQAQNVRGEDVFPNNGASDKTKPVDQFFACLLGRTAAELKDPAAAANGFSALYTNVLLDALEGKRADVLDPSDSPGDTAYYVKPVKLESYLEREVPLRVKALNLENKVNQNPDAIITAHPNWISTVAQMPRIVRRATPVDIVPPGLQMLTRRLVQTALEDNPCHVSVQVSSLVAGNVPGASELAGTAQQVAAPFGPDHFESECGIKVRGASILQFAMAEGQGQLLGSEGNLLRIQALNEPASVVLRFNGNFGTVIPAIPGYLAALTFEGAELIDVAFEPSANTGIWKEYAVRAEEIRTLRGIAASASQHGRFRLDNASDALSIAKKMQFAKSVDPTLSLYAAYAYHDLQETQRIRTMADFLRNLLNGSTFFDLALLGRLLIDKTVDRQSGCIPFTPMFSQGWPLLRAHRVHLDPALNGIERTLRDSVWSLFNGDGVEMLRNSLLSRRVR
jgi:hypothetical protein